MFGWFKRRDKNALKDALMAEAERADALSRDGWAQWINPWRDAPSSPYDHDWIEICTLANPTVHTVRREQLSPTMNVANLYWRPARFAEHGPMIEGAATLASIPAPPA